MGGGNREFAFDNLTVFDRQQSDVEVLIASQENVFLDNDVQIFGGHFDNALETLQVTLHLQYQRGSGELSALQMTDFFTVAEKKLCDRAQRDFVVGGFVLKLRFARLDPIFFHRSDEQVAGAIFFFEDVD